MQVKKQQLESDTQQRTGSKLGNEYIKAVYCHLLMKVKEESEKAGLKFNLQKSKIMASGSITSWQIDGETMETVTDFYFLGLQNHCGQ